MVLSRFALLMVLAIAAINTAPVRADSPIVEKFLENYLSGCARHSGSRGLDRLRGQAYCTCAIAQLRMEGSVAELQVLAESASRGERIDDDPLFLRAVESRSTCQVLGMHDVVIEGSPSRALDRSRDFGAFSIALPPGFLMLSRSSTPDHASFGFHRLHADFRSAATLQVVIRRAETRSGAGREEADEFRLRGLLDELARKRSNWRVLETGEISIGNVRLRRARWQASEGGDQIVGEAYAGSTGDSVVLVRIQDLAKLSDRTMAVMRASVETLRLR